MKEREALEQVLEALTIVRFCVPPAQRPTIEQSITTTIEALAQPEQDWRNAALRIGEDLSSVGPDGYYNMTAQQWLDWAMEQKPRGNNSLAQPEQGPDYWLGYGLQAHTEKPFEDATPLYTTPPQRTEQEQQIETLKRCLFQMQEAAKDLVEQAKSLTPPQRTWVGLTDEDWNSLRYDTEFFAGAEWAEAKLKEKNGI